MDSVYLYCCINQICVGDGKSSGWKDVVRSEGVSEAIREQCLKYQLDDDSIKRKLMAGYTAPQSILKIASNKEYIYVIRTQFERPNADGQISLFSHAYIFTCTDELLQDPNRFLCLDESNFATSLKEAKQKQEELASGKELMPNEFPDVHAALKVAGIRSEELVDFICVIYDQMKSSSGMRSLHDRCNSAEQMRATLYCTYTFLPIHLRRELGFETTTGINPNEESSVKASSGDEIPEERIAEIKRLGFVHYAASKLNYHTFDRNGYFNLLEKVNKGSKFNAKVHKEEMYVCAHHIHTGRLFHISEIHEIESLLKEAIDLRKSMDRSEVLDSHIASIIGEYIERGIKINSKLFDEILELYCSANISDMLKGVIEAFGEIEKNIDNLSSHKKASRIKMNELLKSINGQNTLDIYYARQISAIASLSFRKIKKYQEETASLKYYRSRTELALRKAAEQLLDTSIEENTNLSTDVLTKYLTVIESIGFQEDSIASMINAKIDKCESDLGYRLTNKGNKKNFRPFFENAYNGTSKHIKGWLCIASIVENENALYSLSVMHGILCKMAYNIEDYRLLSSYLEKFKKSVNGEKNEREILIESYNLILRCCKEIDMKGTNKYPVPLDVWLRVARMVHLVLIENVFDIFDGVDYVPRIINENVKETIRNSELMKQGFYLDEAKKYVRQHEKEDDTAVLTYKAVSRWIKIAKKDFSQ